MQGIGNDYIYIDCLHSCPDELPSLSREMSDRHFGIGSDGIILILPSETADFKMRIFNADGSEASMCGNGARCVAKYVHDKHLTDKLDITLETLSGVKHLFLKVNSDNEVTSVTVNMGAPSFSPVDIPAASSLNELIKYPIVTENPLLPEIKLTAVSIGNPHAVVFLDEIDEIDLTAIGPFIENHPLFPARTNVEFVKVNSPNDITMRVWERGSGITMACGTGACASVAAAIANGLTDDEVTVHLDGGDLFIRMNRIDGHIYMTGNAETVFEGVYYKTDSVKRCIG